MATLALLGCESRKRAAPTPPAGPAAPAPAPAASRADPEGPCAETQNGRCLRRDPYFTSARQAAQRVDLARGAWDSGRLSAASLVALQVTRHQGDRLHLHVEPLGQAKIELHIRRWWQTADGWGFADDGFTPAEPGATYEQAWTAEAEGAELIAVESVPPAELRVTLGLTR